MSKLFSVGENTHNWAKHSNVRCQYFTETDSTNLQAKKDAYVGVPGSLSGLYVTDNQTQGRGRGSNTWTTPGFGNSLMSSWTFLLTQPPKPTVTCLAGLAVYRSLVSTWPSLKFSIKSPNDIYLKDKKLAGLLVENIQEGAKNKLIIGLGLNVFEKPALDIATCLAEQQASMDTNTWSDFLERLRLEFTMAAQRAFHDLDLNDRKTLVWALNSFPGLRDAVKDVEANGSIVQQGKTTSWFEL